MVTNTIAPDIDSYWNSIAAAVPVYTSEEQRSALTLYRELAKGWIPMSSPLRPTPHLRQNDHGRFGQACFDYQVPTLWRRTRRANADGRVPVSL
jgi:hypothetical protein